MNPVIQSLSLASTPTPVLSNPFKNPHAQFVGPWVIGECVGKGASGHVKIAKHRRTGQLAAVKILPLQPFLSSRSASNAQAKAEKQRLGIDREIIMMKLMNHPNIMRIYDVYEGEGELYLILEYVEGGELFDYLCSKGRLSAPEALGYFQQIITAIDYCHRFNVAHRDLKPENILVGAGAERVCVSDFGLATTSTQSTTFNVGTKRYMCPGESPLS